MQTKCEKIAMITCYDALTAKIAAQAGADYLLVGDSGGTNVLGYSNVNEVKLTDMCFMTSSVKRAGTNCKIVSDIPYEIVYEKPLQIVDAAKKIIDSGADIVKLEIEDRRIEMLKQLTDANIQVCTHIGYTPQTPNISLEVQGKTLERATELIKFATDSQKFGASMIVLELIPHELSKYISEILDIATIGIGSGPNCDGQVQVWCDICGFSERIYRHSKLFADAKETLLSAFKGYVCQVKSGQFPTQSNCSNLSNEFMEELTKH